MDFLVLGQVTADQPSSSLPLTNWAPPSGMQLADPEFNVSGPIDLVLGSQYFYDFHILDGGRIQIRKLDSALPAFVNTVFGWVAAGESEWPENKTVVNCHLATTETLDSTMQKFWAIEEMMEKPIRSQEEEDCEQHFQATIDRDSTGRYIAQYPKKIGFHEKIGDSRNTALRRFDQLERRDQFNNKGPVIQDDLLDLIIRFRKHTVALVADVAKMYRQVRIHPLQQQKVKTLGVAWETGTDCLRIDIPTLREEEHWTKRLIFSTIAQLYDPLGLVSPVVAWAKIQMQHLWLVSVGWDDKIPYEICGNWKDFYEQLPLLQSFKVPRCVFVPQSTNFHFHVFCDASEAGYGACIYARSTNGEGEHILQLIASKSRVAPIKRLSLPRLELCAALLGAKLYARVSAALRMEGTPCHFWSDSTVTLHWIQSPPNTWQTFVGNRTSEIQLLTHGHKWAHVKGTDNPADLVSRGMLPNEFISNTLWMHGPPWLREDEEDWPKQSHQLPPQEDVLERRKTVLVSQVSSELNPLFERYSSYWRLIRITAYLRRFISRCRSNNQQQETFLTTHELTEAKETLVKLVQQETFAEEIKQLNRKGPLPKKFPLKNGHPIIDEKGILRLGGRLHHSNESYQTKHPIVLPNKHPFTRLVAAHVHSLCFHAGPRMTLATIRREFWPISGKTLANHVCRKCVKCFRQNPVPVAQPLGQLPQARTVPSRPFSTTGVDFCGPVYLKPVHRKAAPQKVYIAVYICFATKAVHLEVVCDLSTDAFIASLRQFIARRGIPEEIRSDNGTNFQGAKTKLNEMYRIFNSKQSSTNAAAKVSLGDSSPHERQTLAGYGKRR
ncbi:uncharacterized protein LOC134208912 [Armigeres subalbatus]|uniref:uncharacterized protein LOC134208912 n=1 Tax=Armigeres subalbatus TaxID=124917 RepID=UPI002ED5A6DB